MLENAYPPGWLDQWKRLNYLEPFEEQSPHTSDESHVLQRGAHIPVTEQEEEAWDYIAAKAGCAE